MELSNIHKPVISEDKTAGIQKIVFEFHPELTEQNMISDSEYKKADLLRRMRNDDDIPAYTLLLKLLLIMLIISTFAAFWQSGSIACIALGTIGIIVILTLRYWLKQETLKLPRFKDHFERYVWEGLKLKSNRQIYIQALYVVFFPIVMILTAISLGLAAFSFQFWKELLIAYVLSTLTWVYIFSNDRKLIKQWKTELLELLPFNPEKPDF